MGKGLVLCSAKVCNHSIQSFGTVLPPGCYATGQCISSLFISLLTEYMCSQLLNYSSLIIYYHLIFSLLFFHNGPSSKQTQLQQNYGVPTQQHISKALLLPIIQAQALVAMKHHLLITSFSHASSPS